MNVNMVVSPTVWRKQKDRIIQIGEFKLPICVFLQKTGRLKLLIFFVILTISVDSIFLKRYISIFRQEIIRNF